MVYSWLLSLTKLGKHNGVVKNMRYFSTEQDKNSGSLVKLDKADFGVDFLEGLINRYFKDHEVPDILRHKDNIVEYLQLKYEKEVAEHEMRRKKKLEDMKRQQEEEQKKNSQNITDVSKDTSENTTQAEEETFEIKEDDEIQSSAKKEKGSDDEGGSDDSSDNMFIEENDLGEGESGDGPQKQ